MLKIWIFESKFKHQKSSCLNTKIINFKIFWCSKHDFKKVLNTQNILECIILVFKQLLFMFKFRCLRLQNWYSKHQFWCLKHQNLFMKLKTGFWCWEHQFQCLEHQNWCSTHQHWCLECYEIDPRSGMNEWSLTKEQLFT